MIDSIQAHPFARCAKGWSTLVCGQVKSGPPTLSASEHFSSSTTTYNDRGMNLSIGRLITASVALLIACLGLNGQTSSVSEWKVDVYSFGFNAGSCAPIENVYFLDNEHLVLSAPVSGVCDKETWWKPRPTHLSVIDLYGHEQATLKRDGVVETKPGPTGFVAICTTNAIDLLSRNLAVAESIPVSWNKNNDAPCLGMIEGLSPSRDAISIREESPGSPVIRHRLFRGASTHLVAESDLTKGQSILAIGDDGYGVRTREGNRECAQFAVDGVDWTYTPSRAGLQFAFLSSKKMLALDDWGKTLVSVAPSGAEVFAADIRKFRPPFVNVNGMVVSATNPRRILYYITGCPLGDFDDCYGLLFHRFVVFDSQTHQPLFHHSFNPNSNPQISPNGHLVAVLDGSELHLYRIP